MRISIVVFLLMVGVVFADMTNLYISGSSTNCVDPKFKEGFAAGVKYGILSFMQNPNRDDVNFHIAEAQEWYWMVVVDNGKTLMNAAGATNSVVSTGKTLTKSVSPTNSVEPDIVGDIIDLLIDGGLMTNAANRLIKEGHICASLGHKWEPGCGMVGCLVMHQNSQRHCSVCGKVESQEVRPWR